MQLTRQDKQAFWIGRAFGDLAVFGMNGTIDQKDDRSEQYAGRIIIFVWYSFLMIGSVRQLFFDEMALVLTSDKPQINGV